MELKYLVIILSILGILILYFLSTLSAPITIDLSQIQEYEGKEVTVEGIVTTHRITSYGGQIIEIKDNNASAIVFVEEETIVEHGDKIQATGTVQKYRDDWEIVVNNNRFVKIIQKWSNSTCPLWQIAENPERYLDTNINVTGIIDREYDSYFFLIDTEGKHSIVVYYDSSRFHNFSQGDTVYVGGEFDYDEETMRFVLEAKEEPHYILVKK